MPPTSFRPASRCRTAARWGSCFTSPWPLPRRVLVFDAIDFGLPPGTLRVLRDGEVPAWGRTKLSPHQTSFNDVLALAQMNGRTPDAIVAIGVQPVELNDFGGSLRKQVSERLAEAVQLAAEQLAAWGFPGTPRAAACRPNR